MAVAPGRCSDVVLREETPPPDAVFHSRSTGDLAAARAFVAMELFRAKRVVFARRFALKTAAQIEERKREAAAAMAEYLAQQKAIDLRTKRLRALRLAAERKTAQREKAVG
jgi:hypothetical protein